MLLWTPVLCWWQRSPQMLCPVSHQTPSLRVTRGLPPSAWQQVEEDFQPEASTRIPAGGGDLLETLLLMDPGPGAKVTPALRCLTWQAAACVPRAHSMSWAILPRYWEEELHSTPSTTETGTPLRDREPDPVRKPPGGV